MTTLPIMPIAMYWTEAMIPISFFIVVGFITWTLVSARSQRIAIENKGKLQEKMMERFSTAAEFADFLRTPEGARYLSTFTETPSSNPLHKTLGSIRAGAVIAMTALGLIVAGYVSGRGIEEGTLAFGLLGLFLGLGFLVAAFVTYRLSKTWGLLDDGHRAIGE